MATQHRMNRVACVLLERREEVAALAEACFRFSPQIAIRPQEAVFIEIGGSQGLFSEASIEARLKVLAQRLLKSPVRVAVGDTAATALVAARYPDYFHTRDLNSLPLDALADYANPFAGDADLQKRILRMKCILESLGLLSVGEFARLPRESLASRLGKEAVTLSARVWGDFEAAWPGFHPAPRIIEREELLDPEAHGLCSDLESCAFVMQGLVDRAMARLRGRGERVSVLEIRFKPEVRQWKVELPLPQGSASGLMPILRERLAFELQRNPLRAPVEGIQIEVLESVPGGGTQRDFFSKKEEEREAWDGLVARLSTKLGKGRVFVAFQEARYLPERAYLRKLISVPSVIAESLSSAMPGRVISTASAQKVEMLEWPDRPARVLRKPEPLAKEGRFLCAPNGKRWKILSWEGPERLVGEWWKSLKTTQGLSVENEVEGFSRDYYRVVTEGGEQLWVFVDKMAQQKNPNIPSFFLHGYFD